MPKIQSSLDIVLMLKAAIAFSNGSLGMSLKSGNRNLLRRIAATRTQGDVSGTHLGEILSQAKPQLHSEKKGLAHRIEFPH
jgi:hypothetical protein